MTLDGSTVVGVDLGGTKSSAALVRLPAEHGPIRGHPPITDAIRSIATPASEGPPAVLDAVSRLIHDVLRSTPPSGPVTVGIGTAGLVDGHTGTIVSSTDAIPDWPGTDVAAGVADRLAALGYPGASVHVDNDVNAHAVGEAMYGSGTDSASLLLVTVGTGVGAAFVDCDAPRRGAHCAAGEIGHVPTPGAEGRRCPCGRPGHLEAVASGPALTRRYIEQTGRTVDARTVIERASSKEPEAVRVVTEGGAALGRALAGLVTMLDPEVVLLGGGVADGGSIWWDTVESTLREELIDVLCDIPLRRPALGASAAILGAAHTAVVERVTDDTDAADPAGAECHA